MATVGGGRVLVGLLLTIASLPAVTVQAEDGVATDGGSSQARSAGVYIDLRIPLGADQVAEIPVALVNDEPITLGEFSRELAAMHGKMMPGTMPGEETYTRLLERLIATRLILLEAENIGLQKLYGLQAQIDAFADKLLRERVMAEALKEVRVDEAEVDALYRRLARAVKLDVVRFTDAAVAGGFEEEIARGGDFTRVSQRLVAEGKATHEAGADYLKLKDLRPPIAKAVSDMEVGAVGQVFQDESGFLVFRLADVRTEEDAAARAEAQRIPLEQAKRDALKSYGNALIEKHARINERLLKSIDFEVEHTGLFGLGETKPVDFDKLLADDRGLATIVGEDPVTITVGDLARAMQAKLYHGPEKAVASGRLNEHKEEALDSLVFKLAAKREAVEQGIDQSAAFLTALEEHKHSLLFGAFIEKVVVPEVTLSEEEVQGYYDDHLGDYSAPPMVRLRSLVFDAKANAEDAAAKLKRGTDFTWVSANVPGQVDKDASDLLPLDNRLLTLSSLPKDMSGLVAGTHDGDVLIYGSPEGYSYVLVVDQMIPAAPQAYAQVRSQIAKIVFNDKLKVAMEGWVEKLKEAYDTRIFVTGFDL